jgi:hypothetical protein
MVRCNLLCTIGFASAMLILPAGSAFSEMGFFDFAGYSYLAGPPAQAGTVTAVAAKFNTIQPNPLWPLDLLGKEYTVMMQDLTIASVNSYGSFQVITYSGGTMEVHADPAKNGTWAPNPVNSMVPSTFLDGGADLIGIFTEMTLFFNTAAGTGTVSGLVNWEGGSKYGGLANPIGWTVFGGVSNHDGLGIPAGYDLAWDPQLYGPETPNPVEKRSWGSVKNAFRR